VLGNSRRGNPGGGVFTMAATSVGWILDKSRSDDFPTFTQTAGPDIFNGASYGSGLFVTTRGQANAGLVQAAIRDRLASME
jgi:hypothetical protein